MLNCYSVYRTLPTKSTLFSKIFDFFGANYAPKSVLVIFFYDSRGDFSVFHHYNSIVAQIREKVNTFYGLIYGSCQFKVIWRVYREMNMKNPTPHTLR